MNLIEQLGGYEKAKKMRHYLFCYVDGGYYKVVDAAIVKYRRQHNIFEEGDIIIFVDDFMHGELMTVAWTRKGEVWMDDGAKRCTDLSMIRHATDAEIKAGCRL